ncbi:MAG: hypothetical protein JJU36_12855 [Phycisphaeraceae bacterium]|nr:hypothetical protein [Phycisphaeraceae bacterium]
MAPASAAKVDWREMMAAARRVQPLGQSPGIKQARWRADNDERTSGSVSPAAPDMGEAALLPPIDIREMTPDDRSAVTALLEMAGADTDCITRTRKRGEIRLIAERKGELLAFASWLPCGRLGQMVATRPEEWANIVKPLIDKALFRISAAGAGACRVELPGDGRTSFWHRVRWAYTQSPSSCGLVLRLPRGQQVISSPEHPPRSPEAAPPPPPEVAPQTADVPEASPEPQQTDPPAPSEAVVHAQQQAQGEADAQPAAPEAEVESPSTATPRDAALTVEPDPSADDQTGTSGEPSESASAKAA